MSAVASQPPRGGAAGPRCSAATSASAAIPVYTSVNRVLNGDRPMRIPSGLRKSGTTPRRRSSSLTTSESERHSVMCPHRLRCSRLACSADAGSASRFTGRGGREREVLPPGRCRFVRCRDSEEDRCRRRCGEGMRQYRACAPGRPRSRRSDDRGPRGRGDRGRCGPLTKVGMTPLPRWAVLRRRSPYGSSDRGTRSLVGMVRTRRAPGALPITVVVDQPVPGAEDVPGGAVSTGTSMSPTS